MSFNRDTLFFLVVFRQLCNKSSEHICLIIRCTLLNPKLLSVITFAMSTWCYIYVVFGWGE